MLLEFQVENFRSIKERQSFSMLAEDRIKELKDSVYSLSDFNVLPAAVLYGRNASGKSNFLRAFKALQFLVIMGSDKKAEEEIEQYEPYALNQKTEASPIEFSVDFIAKDNLRYIYTVSYTRTEIIKEELKFYPKTQPAILFIRKKGKKIKYGEYLTGRKKEIEDLLYPNQLFLSKIATVKNEVLYIPYSFFSTHLFIHDIHESRWDNFLTSSYIKKLNKSNVPNLERNINKLLKLADTGITELRVKEEEIDPNKLPTSMSEIEKKRIIENYKHSLETGHKVYENGAEIGMTFFKFEEESTGTKKLFALGGLVIEALMDGQTLVVDELDKNLHPLLSRAIVGLFQNRKTNPYNAQLIFATHDVSLLDKNIFRRDQVWISEKEFDGSSNFYAVSDISEVRADSPFEKWYMTGRFGGTPVINDNEFFFDF